MISPSFIPGLDDCVLPYINFFINNAIDGCKLLTLTADVLENLNVKKVGHQEIILEGVDLLKLLHYELMHDTLQTQSLRVGCRARTLFNQLKADEEKGSPSDRVSTLTLAGVSGIMEQVKQLVSWIDRYPFSSNPMYMPIRRTILQHSIELVLTAQRDQFVEKPNLIIKNACSSLSGLCDRLVTELNDSLAIIPATLEVIGMKKKENENYFGIQMNSTYNGIHMIVRVQDPSPSSRCGRIEEGDEIIQIRYQTVVGWTMNKVVKAMNDSPQGILITFKKRPTHTTTPMHVPFYQVEPGTKLKEKTGSRNQANSSMRGSYRNSNRSQTLGGRSSQRQETNATAFVSKEQVSSSRLTNTSGPPVSSLITSTASSSLLPSKSSTSSSLLPCSSSTSGLRVQGVAVAPRDRAYSSRSGREAPPLLEVLGPRRFF